MKTNKKQKFSLEKFEVAKLKSLSKIKGGQGDPVTGTGDGSITDLLRQLSTVDCN